MKRSYQVLINLMASGVKRRTEKVTPMLRKADVKRYVQRQQSHILNEHGNHNHKKYLVTSGCDSTDFDILVTMIANVSEQCSKAIYTCLDDLIKELDCCFEHDENLVNVCISKLASYIKMYHMARLMMRIFKNARHIEETAIFDRAICRTIPKLSSTLSDYYHTYDNTVITPPEPFPRGNFTVRLLLKRLSELPYFMHRDIYVLLDRFRASNTSFYLPGINSLLKCLGDSIDTHCNRLRQDLDVFNFSFERVSYDALPPIKKPRPSFYLL